MAELLGLVLDLHLFIMGLSEKVVMRADESLPASMVSVGCQVAFQMRWVEGIVPKSIGSLPGCEP